jgi:hypothetical protein
MHISIGGRWMYLWRAIDQDGEVLVVLVRAKEDKKAAPGLMRKLPKKNGFAPPIWRQGPQGFRSGYALAQLDAKYPPDQRVATTTSRPVWGES